MKNKNMGKYTAIIKAEEYKKNLDLMADSIITSILHGITLKHYKNDNIEII